MTTTTVETEGKETGAAMATLCGSVRDLASRLFKELPAGWSGEGLRFERVTSNVSHADFLVWTHPDLGDVFLEEPACARGDGGRYLHGDFHAWVPAPTYGMVEDFAAAVAGGLVERVREALRRDAVRLEGLTAAVDAA